MSTEISVNGLLAVERIALDVVVASMRPAFEEIGRIVQSRPGPTAAEIAQRLWMRELFSSTALGFGIALPHAHVHGLATPVAAFLRARAPIPFGSPDEQPVSEMLALLIPPGDTAARLELIASFVQLFSEHGFRAALRQCRDAHSVWRLFDDRLRV